MLSCFESLFGFDLDVSQAAEAEAEAEEDALPWRGRSDPLGGSERTVRFTPTAELIAAANASLCCPGGAQWTKCNAIVLDALPCFGGGDGAASRAPPPQKRAVHFVEPFIVLAGESYTVDASHDGLRLSLVPRPSASPSTATPSR